MGKEEKLQKNCTVETELGEVDVGMNRRAWTVLFDFLGLLGEDERETAATSASATNGTSTLASDQWTFAMSVKARSLKVSMNYPDNGSSLGSLYFVNVDVLTTVLLGVGRERLAIKLLSESVRAFDTTPFFSPLYRERLLIVDGSSSTVPSSAVQIEVIKYLGEDLTRECDLSVELLVPATFMLVYTHTHRFFCALSDFWMQFFELHDLVAKQKKILVSEGPKSRAKLKIDVRAPAVLFLPMNQFSDELIVIETKGVTVDNEFHHMSEVHRQFSLNAIDKDYGYDPSVDCFLDCMKVVLKDIGLFEGRRMDGERKKDDDTMWHIGKGLLHDFYVSTYKENVLSRRFDLQVDVYRNLDGQSSHNAPDLTIVTGIESLTWRMTSRFYCLLRGFLEKNLGEPLVPVPEAIPIEILQKPFVSCEVGSVNRYATLSFRMSFDDVELDCEVPSSSSPSTFLPFGKMKLTSARISFDVFVDGQSELDLVCESTTLEDTRGTTANDKPNAFRTILEPREGKGEKGSLMSEAHLLLRKDEPPQLTLVLLNARVLLLHDWLNDAKDFVLLFSDFEPPVETENFNFLCVSAGVVERHPSGSSLPPPDSPQQSFSVKITLRESDLVLLEKPSLGSSLALVAFTSAVLNAHDAGGVLHANLEIQTISLGWCSMSFFSEPACQFTNEFSVAIGLSPEQRTPLKREESRGLAAIASSQSKHSLCVELNSLIGKASYRDIRAVQIILGGCMKQWSRQRSSMIPSTKRVPGKPLEISEVAVKCENADVWLLDELGGSSIPIVRFSLCDVKVQRRGEHVQCSFTVGMDYFNQRVFGWEPLVEPFHVIHLHMRLADRVDIEFVAESKSALDINITQPFLQQAVQFSSRWDAIRQSFERHDFRSSCVRSVSDHLPYELRNETGSSLIFTAAVDEVLNARKGNRKATAKWLSVGVDQHCTFEFPTKLLFYSHESRDDTRALIVRVEGWDEISPVTVDAVGTYFRVVKAVSNSKSQSSVRLVIAVTMEKDGKKVVTVRSSVSLHNALPHTVALFGSGDTQIMTVDPSETKYIPVKDSNGVFEVVPVIPEMKEPKRRAALAWRTVKAAGESRSDVVKLSNAPPYWLCTWVRREAFPEDESLVGHSLAVLPPLSVLNLLPVDVELRIADGVHALAAGKRLLLTCVDAGEFSFSITTDRLSLETPASISRASIGESTQLRLRLIDTQQRVLDVYANVRMKRGDAVSMALWVPYWIVNKSGIPLVIKQEAAEYEAAGQMEEHERARDRHPLMFSFSDDGCPKHCVLRVGNATEAGEGYIPRSGPKFPLTPGVQALKLQLKHDRLPTIFYSIGVEVRAGTGRYKDTQVVLLTSRYELNNQSSHNLLLYEFIDGEERNEVRLAARSSRVWNEGIEGKTMLCVRREGRGHTSCPFRVDRVSSFHVTMRDSDETPRFVRVEIALHSAVFWVTFTDAEFFPPPIQIVNRSDVPVLYHQESHLPTRPHLRSICKAKSTVDYAWDDLYASRRLVLQVYENASQTFDPSMHSRSSLVYDNSVYIQLESSFRNIAKAKNTEECELVLETLQKGKVILNKQNRVDGNGGNQLWRLCRDGCIENVGMEARTKGVRYVLDVLDKQGGHLMMKERSPARNAFQQWSFTPDGRLRCGVGGTCVQARGNTVMLTEPADSASIPVVHHKEEIVPADQVWSVHRQRPGSGVLDVECLHEGPTLIVQITDGKEGYRAPMPVLSTLTRCASSSQTAGGERRVGSAGVVLMLTLKAGIGFSFVNGSHEELLYVRFQGITVHAAKSEGEYQMTASVHSIQADNQLMGTDRWQVFFCQANTDGDEGTFGEDEELPAGIPVNARPALKLELHCAPQNHYDAFECFRLKLCDASVQLDEVLLWKLVQFFKDSGTADSLQTKSLLQPPSLEVGRPDPLKARRCYFGTLDLEVGDVSLSVSTVATSALPRELRSLKRQFNVKLLSFEGAKISLPPFHQLRYFETASFLLETLSKFYFAELQKQTLNIVIAMDAFGNPLGLVFDLRDSFQGLFIEGDVQRFVAGLGYGLSNSLSKVASSMAHGVGSLTFDEEHELKRRHNMVKSDSSSTPLAHLYSGVKGLGVGVVGGMTAIFTNTIQETKKSASIAGVLRGVSTGAVDTVTKPIQGVFDLVGGTASAVKELAGMAAGSGSARRTWASQRVRPPRVCLSLNGLLPPYSRNLANAQLELQRINGFSSAERLLDLEVVLTSIEKVGSANESIVRQYVLIGSVQCYVVKQVNDEPSQVIQRISYKYLKSLHSNAPLANGLTAVEVAVEQSDGPRRQATLLWCSREDVAKRLCEKIMRAKRDYDHEKRTLLLDDDENDTE